MKKEKKINQRGFTLVEIMIVLVIIGILVGVFGGRIFGAGDKAKAQMTRIKITQINSYLEQYRLQYNRLPTSINSLAECTEETGMSCTPIANMDDLKDGWGQPFKYSSDGDGRSFVIKSLGTDGREGGEGLNSDIVGKGP